MPAIGNRQSAIANRQSGFTLIEVLLAIGILAIGCSSVLFLFSMGARSHLRAVSRTRAALLADAVINQVQADLSSTPPARYQLKTDEVTTLPAPGNGEYLVHADYPEFVYDLVFSPLYNGDFYVVRVRVWWGDTKLVSVRGAPDRHSALFETIVRRKSF